MKIKYMRDGVVLDELHCEIGKITIGEIIRFKEQFANEEVLEHRVIFKEGINSSQIDNIDDIKSDMVEQQIIVLR